ncbi:MAG: hypothetical protein A3H96_22110 [Acidobacteria bacterium RIFCSPLOWO2_02_FULL_67_36]|nr:MAG: hypothetical protein A3H96_22110 [Acidobacteria bacterium RIFCSPLOWO2_02_FULL_67_36]OFW19887.1 MAG: hypothetical protein A3G21_09705 [Acidobacteria bacterium RIFCSPLOWO2_12_FULL_66_21]
MQAILLVLLLAWTAAPPAAAARQDQNPDEYVAQMKKGDAALRSRKYEDALKAYKKASSLHNKTSAEAYAGMARVYDAMGAYKSAADSWADALENTSGDPLREAVYRNQRGASLFAQSQNGNDKRLKEAEAEFRAALALDETLAIARFNLGVALLRQARDEEGLPELKAFLAAAPRAPHAAEAERMIENPRRARERYAPDFAIVTLDQQRLALEDLKGKVVLLDFWASWCGPCKLATPGLTRLYKKYGDRPFALVAISLDREESPWRQYIDENRMTWPQYWDRGGRIAQLFGVRPIPTYIVLDHEGIVRTTKEGWGPGTDGALDGEIGKWLKRIPPTSSAPQRD